MLVNRAEDASLRDGKHTHLKSRQDCSREAANRARPDFGLRFDALRFPGLPGRVQGDRKHLPCHIAERSSFQIPRISSDETRGRVVMSRSSYAERHNATRRGSASLPSVDPSSKHGHTCPHATFSSVSVPFTKNVINFRGWRTPAYGHLDVQPVDLLSQIALGED